MPELISISDGQLENGVLHGYGRKIINDGSCQVGFWKQGKPYGKFAYYNSDGSFKSPDGMYIGDNNLVLKSRIQNYLGNCNVAELQAKIKSKF